MGSLERAFARFRKTGDPKALADLFDRTAPQLFRVALHLIGDPHLAEDVVQTTYLVAIEERESFQGRSGVLTWLTGILINRIRQVRRAAEQRPDPARVPDRTENGPYQAAEAQELSREVSDAIAKLPERYQSVLNLHLAHGLQPHEIAVALVRPPGTVRAQISRGLARMRRTLPKGLAGLVFAAVAPSRGLASVRAEVLRAVPVPSGLIPLSLIGGILATKKTLLSTAATVAAVLMIYAVVTPPAGEVGSWSTPPAVEPVVAESVTVNADARGPTLPTAREYLSAVDTGLASSHLTVHVQWEDGSPAGGVRVQVADADANFGIRDPNPWLSVDDAGSLELDLSPGDYTVSLDRANAGLGEITLDPGEREEILIQVPSGLTVQGLVVDSESRPFAGANVWLSRSQITVDHGLWIASTERDGSFRLRGVEPRRFLAASAEGFQRARGIRALGDPGATVPIVLELGGEAASLRVIAAMPDGSSAVGASVLAGFAMNALQLLPGDETGPPPVWGTTDEAGIFVTRMLNPDGPVLSLLSVNEKPKPKHLPLWVRAKGTALWGDFIPVDAEQEMVVRVQLRRGGSARGRVLSSAGDPVPGAPVSAKPLGLPKGLSFDTSGPAWGWARATTDEGGRFELVGLYPGEVRLSASHPNHGRATSDLLTIGDGETLEQDLVLVRYHSISGIVVDSDGFPLKEMRVQAESAYREWFQTPTFEDGQFRFAQLRKPGDYVLTVIEDTPFRDVVARVAGIPADSVRVRIEVPDEALSNSWFVGTALDSDGRPLSRSVSVRIRDLGAADGTRRDHTDIDYDAGSGRFRLGPVPPGAYELRAEHPDTGSMTLGAYTISRSQELDLGRIQWSHPGRLRVTVLDSEGRPHEQGQLSIGQPGGRAESWIKLEGGQWDSPPLQPGNYEVRSTDGPWLFASAEVLAGQDAETTLRLPPLVRRTLQYPPVPVRQTKKTEIWRSAGNVVYRRTSFWSNTETTTTQTHVAVGTFDVEVISADGRRAVTRFTVTAEPASDEVLVMPSPF